jgi:hypothetical protein
LCPTAASIGREVGSGVSRILKDAVNLFGIFPRHQNLSGRTGLHGECSPNGNRVTKTREALGNGDTEADIALALVQLSRFAGGITERCESRASSCNQAIFAGSKCEFGRAWTQNKTTIEVASHKAMVFKGNSETMCRRTGDSGHSNKLCKRVGARFECAEDGDGFV